MQRHCGDVNSPYKRKCWTNSGGPLTNSLLWGRKTLTYTSRTIRSSHWGNSYNWLFCIRRSINATHCLFCLCYKEEGITVLLLLVKGHACKIVFTIPSSQSVFPDFSVLLLYMYVNVHTTDCMQSVIVRCVPNSDLSASWLDGHLSATAQYGYLSNLSVPRW